jgi:hypothetical protein
MRRAGYVVRRGRGKAYTGFWWGNPREREDNFKADIQEVGCGVMDWIEL